MVVKCGGNSRNWRACWSLPVTGWSVWRWIVQESSWFWKFGLVDPGGGWVSFWFDHWVGEESLSERFPRVAAIAQSRDAFVCEFFSGVDRLQWDIPLSGTLRGGAERERVALLELLNTIPPSLISEGPAFLVWPLERSGVYSVRSLARRMILQQFPGCSSFPAEMVWMEHVPTKVAGFVWQVVHKKVSTVDNLIRRGLIIPNMCVMCGSDAESVDHLFGGCSFASQVWSYFSSRLSLFGPFPLGVKDWLWAWKGMSCSSGFNSCVRMLIHGFLWGLWGERNDRIFRDIGSTPKAVACRIVVLVGRWCVAGGLMGRDRFGLWLWFCGVQAGSGAG
ncbi:Putative ribonuclease H protein At1g65750 [Linum perenne]